MALGGDVRDRIVDRRAPLFHRHSGDGGRLYPARQSALRSASAAAPVSILLAGHNEEGAIEKCVRSLRKQTFNNFEIVCVDDGSSDQTFAIMRRLQSLGLVQSIGRLQLRGGKASASNLAARMAHGDILILTDCDCSFEHRRHRGNPAPYGDRRVRRRGLRQHPRAQLATFFNDCNSGDRISRCRSRWARLSPARSIRSVAFPAPLAPSVVAHGSRSAAWT